VRNLGGRSQQRGAVGGKKGERGGEQHRDGGASERCARWLRAATRERPADRAAQASRAGEVLRMVYIEGRTHKEAGIRPASCSVSLINCAADENRGQTRIRQTDGIASGDTQPVAF